MADRIGVISRGELILVENKRELMQKLGKKQLILQLQDSLETVPESLALYNLSLNIEKRELTYRYDTRAARTGITALLADLNNAGIRFKDLRTAQSSLEDIFISLIKEGA